MLQCVRILISPHVEPFTAWSSEAEHSPIHLEGASGANYPFVGAGIDSSGTDFDRRSSTSRRQDEAERSTQGCQEAHSVTRTGRNHGEPLKNVHQIYLLLETYQAMLWYSSECITCKNSKIALLEYFSTGTKIVGNHSKFYLSLMKTSGKHPVHF